MDSIGFHNIHSSYTEKLNPPIMFAIALTHQILWIELVTASSFYPITTVAGIITRIAADLTGADLLLISYNASVNIQQYNLLAI